MYSEIYLKINEIIEKIIDILIGKYCNTYRNTFENITIYRDTKISPDTQPTLVEPDFVTSCNGGQGLEGMYKIS